MKAWQNIFCLWRNKIRFLNGDYMNRNNASWVCDRLEELIKEYESAKENTYDDGTYWTYDRVLEDLRYILYGEEY